MKSQDVRNRVTHKFRSWPSLECRKMPTCFFFSSGKECIDIFLVPYITIIRKKNKEKINCMPRNDLLVLREEDTDSLEEGM